MALTQTTNSNSSGHDGLPKQQIKRDAGTYVLVLRADTSRRIRVGRWGVLDVQPGYYLYVGSAFGPGGVKARVSRHCRQPATRHWHIDYLRDVTEPKAVWCGYGSRDLEHCWAQALVGMSGVSSVSGFGCSDCKCEAHLFSSPRKPDFERFCAATGADVQAWPLQVIAEGVKR